MSDVSVLAQEYKTAADLAQDINRALIAVKKVQQALPGAESVTADQLASSRRRLADILLSLRGALDPGEDRGEAQLVTGALTARLQAEHRGELAYYLEDLRKVAERLRDRAPCLSEKDIALLDDLASAADAQTSHVFRRLMRT
jgi:hypothetical protein